MASFKALSVGSIIGGAIMLAIAFQALGQTIPVIQNGLHNLTHYVNSTGSTVSRGIPFAGLFSNTGIIILAILGAVLLAVVSWLGFKEGR